MSGQLRSSPILWIATAAMVVLGAPSARALEPVDVTVEMAVPIEEGAVPSALRQEAESRALRQAVLEVALRYVPDPPSEEDLEALRQALAEEAPRFILTYRIEGTAETRPSAEDPAVDDYVVSVTAVVDATRVREALERLGFVQTVGPRPSLALLVQPISLGRASVLPSDPGPAAPRRPELALEPLEQFLSGRLSAEGYVVVEPALYPATGTPARSAVELARSLGADLGVGIDVTWTPLASESSGAARGGIAGARLRSIRAKDGVELASARFEAPGYSSDPQQAFQRAIDALRDQLASSLLFQLEQNLVALESGAGTVRVRLSDVGGLAEIERIQETLLEILGAREARLERLEPRAVELVVDGDLSPGALQERMVGAAYDGFRLELVEMGADRIELRIVPGLELPAGADRSRPGGGPN